MNRLAFVTEPLLHPHFVQFDIVVPLLSRLRSGWEPTLVAPYLSDEVIIELEKRGIRAINLGSAFPRLRNSRDEIPSYVWSWGRDALLGLNERAIDRALNRGFTRINFSMTSACAADCWFAQSRPLGPALKALRPSANASIRAALSVATPFVSILDWRHIAKMARRAGRVYTSTRHVGEWFHQHGIEVEGNFPIYYSPFFRPSSASPTRDYILCYLAKETDAIAMTALLETGLPIRLFGAKSADWVSKIFRGRDFPNAQMLGRVSMTGLRELYSNALITAFPFTEEPFGLIPLESMACGTPVLTYGMQGPGESVLDGKTGWLARTGGEFVDLARRIFRDGYPTEMVGNCLDRARDFSLDTAVVNWNTLLTSIHQGA